MAQARWRQGWMFGAGALAAAVLAVAAYVTWFARPAPVSPATAALPPDVAQQIAQAQQQPVVEQVAATAEPAMRSAACNFEPLVAASAQHDGQFQLEAALAIHRSTDHAPFLAVADEAAREGRARDTEVALIAACRIAGRMGAISAPLADVQSRLAQHYAAVARQQGDAAVPSDALLARAEGLLGGSVQAYAAALGKNASKTRLAERRLTALRERSALPQEPEALPERQTVTAERPRDDSDRDTSRMGAARASLVERGPRMGEDLAQVDRDLQRLYAQARSVSSDPAGVQQRHQQALAARKACRDQACLRNWYAERRRQLFEEF